MRRLSPNTWVLIITLFLIAVMGVDLGRRYMTGAQAETEEPPAAPAVNSKPDFKVGDAAPDFELPDSSGKKFKISELVKGRTLLDFSCGCSNCRQLETYLGEMVKKLGPQAPTVVTITSKDPVSEAAWVRDTGLVQRKLLYVKDDRKVMDTYKGHPCPRVFELQPGPKVAWIGSSPMDQVSVQSIGEELANHLGLDPKELQMTGPETVAPMPDGMPSSGGSPMPAVAPAPAPKEDLTVPPYAGPLPTFAQPKAPSSGAKATTRPPATIDQ